MNILDQPAHPEHPAILNTEFFLCSVEGWDVWVNPDGNWLNVNYGPGTTSWFCVQGGCFPDGAKPEVMAYLRTLASLHQ